MAMVSNKNIIDTRDEGIVVKERPISLSDEKLRNALSRAYEEAQKDMSKFHFCNLYSVFLSIAGTLFLSLLTSDFHALGSVTAESITFVAWILFGVFGVLSISFKKSIPTLEPANCPRVGLFFCIFCFDSGNLCSEGLL